MGDLDRQDGGGENSGALAPLDLETILRNLDEELDVGLERIVLFARATEDNHPCTRMGGFDDLHQLANSAKLAVRPKGARGWPSYQAMQEAEFDLAKKHGVSGLGLIEGIKDYVWELTSVESVAIADLTDHPLTRSIDMSSEAVAKATPGSPQGRVLTKIRGWGDGVIGGVDLPTRDPGRLPLKLRVQHRERHLMVFPDRVSMRDKNLGRWKDILGFR